jgi:hypothetical protein
MFKNLPKIYQKFEKHHMNFMCISKKIESSQHKRLKMPRTPTIGF